MKKWFKYGFLVFIICGFILAFWAYNSYISPKKLTEKTQLEQTPKVKAETIHAKQSKKIPMTDLKKAHAKSATQSKQKQPAKKKVALNAPLINQEPDLDRGCEVTSLAMMLQYAGVHVSKMTLADKIKKVPFRDDDGVRSNPNDGFVGNMETFKESGLGVYHGPLADLARDYLPNHIIDMTGDSFDKIIKQLQSGIPVVVITNYTFKRLPESAFTTWHTNTGDVKITYDQHSVLITGYDATHIYFNDPLGEKNSTADRNSFIAAWKQMGSQAISYTKSK